MQWIYILSERLCLHLHFQNKVTHWQANTWKCILHLQRSGWSFKHTFLTSKKAIHTCFPKKLEAQSYLGLALLELAFLQGKTLYPVWYPTFTWQCGSQASVEHFWDTAANGQWHTQQRIMETPLFPVSWWQGNVMGREREGRGIFREGRGMFQQQQLVPRSYRLF